VNELEAGVLCVRLRRIGVALVVSGFIASAPAARAADDVTLRTVAFSGQPAPGLGQPFYTFDTPVLNDAGRVAFGGSVNVGSPTAVWSEGMGSLSVVAARGQNAPGTDLGSGPATFSAFSGLILNDAGQTAFVAQFTGADVVPANARAVYSQTGAGGALRKVARLGDPAPSFPGFSDVFQDLRDLRLDDAGRVAFPGNVVVPGGSRGAAWWEEHSTGQLRPLARQDAPAPGLTPPGNFHTIANLTMNDQGQALLSSLFVPGSILWSSGGKVFKSFEMVPGRNAEWLSFDGDPVLNNAGEVAFTATTRPPGGGATTVHLWATDANGVREIYRPGMPAPGFGAGGTFGGGSLPSPVINKEGDVAFRANVNTAAGTVGTIYATRNGGQTLELLARTGQPAPGTPAGTVISGFPVGMEAPAFNARGTAAFIAGLAGPGVTMANDQALYAIVSGVWRLIARKGDPIQVAPGLVRTVTGFSLLSDTGNEEGRASALNEYDQLAFAVGMNDAALRSAVIVADAGLAGDVDADRDVDFADFVLFRQNFGAAGHRGQGDFDGDGRITFLDFQILERNFGRSLFHPAPAGAMSMVPEPISLWIVGMVGVLSTSRRRRTREAPPIKD
jgi:hypothetical protein